MARPPATHIDDPAAVGRRLRSAREQAGLSQRELGSSCSCTAAYISRIEAGQRSPSLQVLHELSSRLGVTVGYLARGLARETSTASRLAKAEIALRLDYRDEAGRLYQDLLDQADNPRTRSCALEGLGHVAFAEGEPAEAIEALEEALRIVGDDVAARPRLAETLACAHATLGQFGSAVTLLERCVSAYEQGHDLALRVRLASLLGHLLTDAGDVARAEQIVIRASELTRDAGAAYERAHAYWRQSQLLGETGEDEAAAGFAQRALDVIRASDERVAVAQCSRAHARICLELGRPQEAIALLDEGWPIASREASSAERAHYRIEQARALAAAGQDVTATAIAVEVADQFDKMSPQDQERACLPLVEIWERVGETTRAREFCELAVERLRSRPPSARLIATYRKLAALLRQEGHTEQAFELLERAVDLQGALLR